MPKPSVKPVSVGNAFIYRNAAPNPFGPAVPYGPLAGNFGRGSRFGGVLFTEQFSEYASGQFEAVGGAQWTFNGNPSGVAIVSGTVGATQTTTSQTSNNPFLAKSIAIGVNGAKSFRLKISGFNPVAAGTQQVWFQTPWGADGKSGYIWVTNFFGVTAVKVNYGTGTTTGSDLTIMSGPGANNHGYPLVNGVSTDLELDFNGISLWTLKFNGATQDTATQAMSVVTKKVQIGTLGINTSTGTYQWGKLEFFGTPG